MEHRTFEKQIERNKRMPPNAAIATILAQRKQKEGARLGLSSILHFYHLFCSPVDYL